MRRSLSWLLFFILSAQAAGIAGSFLVGGPDSWYQELQKPFLNPPSLVFAPVWTTLYVLMGIAAYRLWRLRSSKLLALYWLQLLLNAVWTPLFFGLRAPGWALADIVLLDVLVVVLIVLSLKKDRLAAYLLIPYLAWIAFATYLNLMIVLLN